MHGDVCLPGLGESNKSKSILGLLLFMAWQSCYRFCRAGLPRGLAAAVRLVGCSKVLQVAAPSPCPTHLTIH
jgi:hypothetical protein